MGTVTKSIGSGGGRDYSTLQAWEDALPANLVTDGNHQVGECYNDSEFVVAGVVLAIAGETTDSTHTITVKCASGQSFRDNASVQSNALKYNVSNGVGLRATASYTNAITVGSGIFAVIDGLQAQSPNGSAIAGGGSNTTVQNTIAEASNPFYVIDSCGNVLNTLVVNRAGGSSSAGIKNSVSNMTCVSCTCVNPSGNAAGKFGIFAYYSTVTVKNCASFGFTDSFGGGGTFSGSNNCSDSTIGFGSSNQASKTYANQFVNTADATRDFRLKAGADCIDTGVTDTTNIPAGDDIAKTARPSGSAWDIGAWEYVAAGGGAISGTVDESATLADAPSAIAAFAAALSEALAAADSPSAALVAVASLAEVIAAADGPTAIFTAVVSAAESMAAADGPAAIFTAPVGAAESMAAADAANWGAILSATLDESATLGDSPAALAAFAGALNEIATSVDSVSSALVAVAAAAETAASADAMSAAAAWLASLSESGALIDSAIGVLPGGIIDPRFQVRLKRRRRR